MNNNQNTHTGDIMPSVLLTPLKSAVIAGHDQRVQVLVQIQAPDSDASQVKERPPYHLALVIDRSGSMSGEPLEEAKRCAGYVIDQLRPTDRAALVQFDSQVQVLSEAAPVDDRTALHRALLGVHSGGTTNLHGGWVEGAQSLEAYVREAGLSRVIILSDGNANEGLIDSAEIAKQCGAFADKHVTTSTYGLGRDFNEELMVEMAKAGQGNHYYGETAQDLFEPFAEEFDLIANLYARNLHLTLATTNGIRATVLNDYDVKERRGEKVVRMPDLAWNTGAWAMVELQVPSPADNAGGAVLLSIKVTGVDIEGKPIDFPAAQIKLPTVSVNVWDALLPNPLVQRRLAELAAAKLLEQAQTAAKNGNWEAIEAMLVEARSQFADNPWLQQVLASMVDLALAKDKARFSKEAMFSSRRMRNRLSAKEEAASLGLEQDAPSFLRRKSAQGKAQFRRGPDEGGSAPRK